MSKRKQFIIGGLAVLLCLLGIGGWHMLEKQHLQERMTEVVESEEAKQIYLERLKQIDPNALTEKGIIKTYRIDKKSVKHNPMGGIIVILYINNTDYDVSIFIHNDPITGRLINGGGSNPPLKKLQGAQ